MLAAKGGLEMMPWSLKAKIVAHRLEPAYDACFVAQNCFADWFFAAWWCWWGEATATRKLLDGE